MAERRDATKKRKIQRACQALEEVDEGGDKNQIDDLVAPTNVSRFFWFI